MTGVVTVMHYLLLANQTLGGQALRDKLRQLAGPHMAVHLVVPATPANPVTDAELGATDEITAAQIGRKRAQRHLREGLDMLADEGIDATGEVGHPDPMEAIADAMAGGTYDELIVSTLPVGISRWIRMDLPSRAMRKFDIPVTHIEFSE